MCFFSFQISAIMLTIDVINSLMDLQGYSVCVCVCQSTLEKGTFLLLSSQEEFRKYPPNPLCYEISEHTRRAAPAWREAAVPLGRRRKGSPPVGAPQQLLRLTFGPWSKRPALSGVNIKWWTFSSRAALYLAAKQTAGTHQPALIGIHRRLYKWLWGC